MQQISAVSLTDLPVLAVDKKRGVVKKVAFDTTTGTVLGIIVANSRKDKIIYREKIASIDAALTVRRPSDIAEITPGSLADRANQQDRHVIGLAAVTTEGEPFGTVTDALLRAPSFILTHLVVKEDAGERLIPKDQIKEITDTAVIFFDSVVKGHLNWQTKIEPGSVPA